MVASCLLLWGIAGTGGAAVTDDQREAYEERAGILEYCAGMTREEAERVAMAMIVEKETHESA